MRTPMQPSQAELLADEVALRRIPAPGATVRGVLLYPNTYRVGMSNLAVHYLLGALNCEGVACERAFVPRRDELFGLQAAGRPLTSLETNTPLGGFDFVAVTCSYELDYLNIPLALQVGGIHPVAEARGEGDPLVLMGGPAVTANPEPMATFADAIVIGELEPVEEQLRGILRKLGAGAGKGAVLEELATLPGVYVPSLTAAGKGEVRIRRLRADNLDEVATSSVILTPHTEFGGRFLIEVARGCGRSCHFCLARRIYHPVRLRRPATIIAAFEGIKQYSRRIGLISAALSDYPWIDELCRGLRSAGAQLSVATVRAESVTRELVQTLAASGQRSITYAPEAGSEQLRRAIGKPMTDEQLSEAVALAAEAGLRGIKLYFMIGLPGESADDIEAIGALVQRLEEDFPALHFTVSVSPLVPKPHTKLELYDMPSVAELKRRSRQLWSLLQGRRGVRLRLGSARWALVQAAFSRGGRELGQVILNASLEGGTVHDVQAAMSAAGLRLDAYRSAVHSAGGRLPWQIVQVNDCRACEGLGRRCRTFT